MSNEKISVEFNKAINFSLINKDIINTRHDLAEFTSKKFSYVAKSLLTIESNEKSKSSDEGVALILKVGAALISGASDLIQSGNNYGGAALIRQIVEVEYLAWAFEENTEEAEKWINSTKQERMQFFTPSKLRKAAQGKFRSKDYGYHCDLGGHPTPSANDLIEGNSAGAQLLLSDMLGHSGRIWDHIIRWGHREGKTESVLSHYDVMLKKYTLWKKIDATAHMPPPP